MKQRNYKRVTSRIVSFIKDTFKEKGYKKAIIGISGGIDSAVIAQLLVLALGRKNVIGYHLPCYYQADVDDVMTMFKFLKLPYNKIDIKKMMDAYANGNIYGQKSQMRIANLKARCRMITLYDQSYEHNALVVGTGNRTELELGYFTLHGDGACALEPLGHLYKTEVFELAKYLKIPETIVNKAPSAGLWDGQTDESELGTTYAEIDKCLAAYDGFSNNDYCLLNSVNNSEVDKTLFVKLASRIDKNKFKSELPKMIKER